MTETTNDVCDRCGKVEAGVGAFAKSYRKIELRRGRRDPGNLCGGCAGSETGQRIAMRLTSDRETHP